MGAYVTVMRVRDGSGWEQTRVATQGIDVFLSRKDDRHHRNGPPKCLPACIPRLDPFRLPRGVRASTLEIKIWTKHTIENKKVGWRSSQGDTNWLWLMIVWLGWIDCFRLIFSNRFWLIAYENWLIRLIMIDWFDLFWLVYIHRLVLIDDWFWLIGGVRGRKRCHPELLLLVNGISPMWARAWRCLPA